MSETPRSLVFHGGIKSTTSNILTRSSTVRKLDLTTKMSLSIIEASLECWDKRKLWWSEWEQR